MTKKSSTPAIRFKGFTDTWEQRKFADVVQIERGGSPRPIDDYITDSPNGLNWVKIGDAPAQGHYITKTAEKIRPEGLSKTREVHPGDLILSNSMSFGKPYIMGIDGCIHDGWLLIRDINSTFDLTFLCHLLGTPQMLDQYRSLAAGSTVNNLNKELVGKSITFDNGSEFMDCAGIEKSIYGKDRKRTKVYYCHPYSAYERGTNENINKMIRRFLPKGTDFRKVTAAYIQRVETWINNYPREILGFETSGSLFERYVAEAA